MSQQTILLYADGSCIGNPGPGGWACILKFGEHRKELSGHEEDTTNNQMELRAVIEGLRVIHSKRDHPIEVFTDSQYVRNAVEDGWLNRWKSNGWKTANKKAVKNQSLWKELLYLKSHLTVSFNWIPAHSGIPENERADAMALSAAKRRR